MLQNNENSFPFFSFSDVLRKVIVEQISNMMVLPNKFPVVLSETIPAQTIKTPEPEVILLIFVISSTSYILGYSNGSFKNQDDLI